MLTLLRIFSNTVIMRQFFQEPQSQISEVIAIVRSKIRGIPMQDDDIILAMREAREVITRYCHIRKVPGGNSQNNPYNSSGCRDATFLWANMSTDILLYMWYKWQERAASTGECNGGVTISDQPSVDGMTRIQLGDSSITLGANDGTDSGLWKQAHRPNLDDLIMNYRDQLNEHRRLPY